MWLVLISIYTLLIAHSCALRPPLSEEARGNRGQLSRRGRATPSQLSAQLGAPNEHCLLATEDMNAIPARTRYSKGSQHLGEYRKKLVVMSEGEIPRPTPTFEITRLEALGKLRKRLHKCVQAEGCDSRRGWVRCFERWVFHSSLMDDFRFHLPSGEAIEPFLPCGTSEKAQELLKRDLAMLEGMSEEGAARVAATITIGAQKVTKAVISRFAKQTREGVPADASLQRVEVIRNENNDHVYLRLGTSDSSESLIDPREVAYQQQDYRVHTCSGKHLAKLRILWERSRQERHGGDDADFYRDVFSLLTRYQALEGKGYQAGTPPAVYKELRRSFGVTGELFASPLNCYFRGYFSAFPDTDCVFGSLGSFYDMEGQWDPRAGGSFAGNPPFIQYGILRAAAVTYSIINRGEAAAAEDGVPTPPLSFVLIVPAWSSDDASASSFYESMSRAAAAGGALSEAKEKVERDIAYDYMLQHASGTDLHMGTLLAHPFLRAHIQVDSSQHCYVDGFQHLFSPPGEEGGVSSGDSEDNQEREICAEGEGEGEEGEGGGGGQRRKVSWRESKRKGQGGTTKDYYRPVSFDTAIVVIQNDSGARKWPVTKQKEGRIRRLWADLAVKNTTPGHKYVPKSQREALTSATNEE